MHSPSRSLASTNPLATLSALSPFKTLRTLLAALTISTLSAATLASAQAVDSSLSFFITGTSLGNGGNLGGLSGADAHCQSLAAGVGAGGKTWRAYLSTQAVGGAAAVNARDRIGTGPWFNANKVKVASNVAELHGTNNLGKTTSLTQTGAVVNGRGDTPNNHDIMTGSKADGTAPGAGADSTCSNWTSSASNTGRVLLGHHDRMGISSNIDPQSWNQAHVSGGCSQANVQAGGGAGYFYCFAVNATTGLRAPDASAAGSLSAAGAADRAPYVLGAMPRGSEIVYRFTLERRERVQVAVHDLEGRRRAVLVDGMLNAGRHAAQWDGSSANGLPLPAGVYLIALTREGRALR